MYILIITSKYIFIHYYDIIFIMLLFERNHII